MFQSRTQICLLFTSLAQVGATIAEIKKFYRGLFFYWRTLYVRRSFVNQISKYGCLLKQSVTKPSHNEQDLKKIFKGFSHECSVEAVNQILIPDSLNPFTDIAKVSCRQLFRVILVNISAAIIRTRKHCYIICRIDSTTQRQSIFL